MKKYQYVLNLVLILFLTIFALDSYSMLAPFFDVVIKDNHFKNIFSPYIALFSFLLLLSSMLPKRAFKITLVVLFIPITFFNFFIIGHLIYFKSPLTYSDLQTILDTNMSEVSEFLLTLLSYKSFVFALLIMLPFIVIFFMEPVKIRLKPIIAFLLIIAVGIFAFTYNKRWVKQEISFLELIDTFNQTKKDKELFFASLNEFKDKKFDFGQISNKLNKNNKQTFVVVIGESHNKVHSSLYGYKRNTMPSLSQLSEELFVFNDVITTNVNTSAVLQKVLTFYDKDTFKSAYSAKNIIDYFKSAGFKTYWLSNQYYLGENDSTYAAIGLRTDKAVFLNDISGKFLETRYLDDKLSSSLEDALSDENDKKIIFIHLMGSHTPFPSRYPKGFGSFTDKSGYKYDKAKLLMGLSKKEIVDSYDNSIEFTDIVLFNFIEQLKQKGSESFLLYFSDHGEDVYDTSETEKIGRNDGRATKPQYEIPFILWLSDSYLSSYKDFAKDFKNYTDRPYQIDKVINSIIDLSRLNSPDFDECYSIFSSKYQTCPRFVSDKEIK